MGKLKVAVLGDGLLASEIVKQTSWDFFSRKKDNISLENLTNLFLMISEYDVILNCIANTNTYSLDYSSHWDVNFKFVDKLIDFCNQKNIKLVHISTDYIYTNSISNASEIDVPVHFNSWYSYTKLLSDGLVQLRCKDYLICRCTHKPNPFPYEKAWIDQIGNFDYVDIISSLIIKLINRSANGVFNVGTEVKTMYELSKITSNTEKVFSPEITPKNTSMSLIKLKKFLNE